MLRGMEFLHLGWYVETVRAGVCLLEISIKMIDGNPVSGLVSSISPYPLHLTLIQHSMPGSTLTPMLVKSHTSAVVVLNGCSMGGGVQ